MKMDFEYAEIKDDINDMINSPFRPHDGTFENEETMIYWDASEEEPSAFLNTTALAVYEVTHGELTKRMRAMMSDYIARYDRGEFTADFYPGDEEEIAKDIELVRNALRA